MFRSTAARMMRLSKRRGSVRPDDGRHGHFGMRSRENTNDPWVTYCHGCGQSWAELKAADFLPKCPAPNETLIFVHWSADERGVGTWPLDNAGVVDIDKELGDALHVNVVERELNRRGDIRIQWPEGNPARTTRAIQLKWSDEKNIHQPVRESPTTTEPAEDALAQGGAPSPGETLNVGGDGVLLPAQPGDDAAGLTLPGEEGADAPSNLEGTQRAYWKRLQREYDI